MFPGRRDEVVSSSDEMLMACLKRFRRPLWGAILCTTVMEMRRVYHFNGVTLDLETMRLRHDGNEVALEPKLFYLLEFLIVNRDRVVLKEEIFRSVWKDVVVTDNALTRAIAQIRKAVNDDPRNPRFIETVPTVGYRFIAPIESVKKTATGQSVARLAWWDPDGMGGQRRGSGSFRWSGLSVLRLRRPEDG